MENPNIENLSINTSASAGSIFDAIAAGASAAEVHRLIDLGANVNLARHDGWTVLHEAIYQRNEDLVDLLIQHGGNVDAPDRDGLTPLHWAVKFNMGSLQTIIKLSLKIDAIDKKGQSALHIAANSRSSALSLLLQKNPNLEIQDYKGLTPLALAAKHSVIGNIYTLHQSGANVNTRSAKGMTPLLTAVAHGQSDVADALLDCGADLQLDNNGDNALHYAIKIESESLLLNFLKQAEHLALQLTCGANANGATPLHEAVLTGNTELVRLLVVFGSPLEARNMAGQTVLHLACFKAHPKILKLLIKAGARVNRKTTEHGDTGLHIAARHGQIDIIKILLKHGASLEATTNQDQTALHVATQSGDSSTVSLLLENGAEIEARDEKRRTPLLIAAGKGDHEVVLILLKNSAALNKRDEDGMTALHLAAAKGSASTIKLLKGCEPDGLTNSGATALHFAAANGHVEAVADLVGLGVPIDTVTTGEKVESALQMAIEAGHIEIIAFLLASGAHYSIDVLRVLLRKNGLFRALRQLNPIDCPFEFSSFINSYLAKEHSKQSPPTLQASKLIEVVGLLGNSKYDSDAIINLVSGYMPSCPPEQIPSLLYSLVLGNIRCGVTLKDLPPEQAYMGNSFKSKLYLALEQHGFLKKYIKAEANFDTLEACHENTTPLITAIACDNRSLAKMLLEYGASVNLPDETGHTPLHYAVLTGNIKWVRLLLKFHATRNLPNPNDDTAMDIALEKSYADIADLLGQPDIAAAHQ